VNVTRDIQSLTDLRLHTLEFVQQLKTTGEPLVLTINGKAELVVQDARSYQKLLDLAEQAKIHEGIRLLEGDEQNRLAELRREVAIGIEQADHRGLTPFDPQSTLATIRKRRTSRPEKP
jgi:PHD/YefM family antitoxin component YafN of YafNO toxin-antitoxin module